MVVEMRIAWGRTHRMPAVANAEAQQAVPGALSLEMICSRQQRTQPIPALVTHAKVDRGARASDDSHQAQGPGLGL